MEPNSPALLIFLLLGAGGLLVALVRYRHIAIRITCGLFAVVLAGFGGMAVVNDYYGYYQTWSQLGADLSGNYDAIPGAPVSLGRLPQPAVGKIESVQLPGALSGINRPGLVYLPPQYFQAKYAQTAFPVVELLHGSPGTPSAWIVHLQLARIAGQLLSQHLVGPMVLVMPAIDAGHNYEDCVDAPKALDDTYITQDVRNDIEARFRVSTVPAEWAVAGYSSGGYCAANLALRHPADFGASGIMDGYFRAQDGPAARALHHNPAAEAANDPLQAATLAGRNGGPLPAFWLSAGDGDAADIGGVRAFIAALHDVEAVPFYRIPGASHNFYAWEPSIPYFLQWVWTEIAPPDLRVQFPIAGPVTSTNITLSPQRPAGRHTVPPKPPSRAGAKPRPGASHPAPVPST